MCCSECKEDLANKTWEPPAAAKGQIARMLLYMDVRYEGTDISETNTPDLTLVDRSTQILNPDPNLTYYPELGYLSELLRWHCDYPVSDKERLRNDGVESWQGNRNPFIDIPDFARKIWNDPTFDSIWSNCGDNTNTPSVSPTASSSPSIWINEFHYVSSTSSLILLFHGITTDLYQYILMKIFLFTSILIFLIG